MHFASLMIRLNVFHNTGLDINNIYAGQEDFYCKFRLLHPNVNNDTKQLDTQIGHLLVPLFSCL